jgi:hypothetical protein
MEWVFVNIEEAAGLNWTDDCGRTTLVASFLFHFLSR